MVITSASTFTSWVSVAQCYLGFAAFSQIAAIELFALQPQSMQTSALASLRAGLSPLLFILFISGCSSQLHCSHAEYADDITLWYSGSCPHTIRAMLNADLRAVESWAQRMRLQFGDKNKYFVFPSTSCSMPRRQLLSTSRRWVGFSSIPGLW